MQLDLASMKSIRAFAEEFNSNKELPTLGALICNAGLQVVKPATTAEGHEMTFGVNHLGHFMLANILLKVCCYIVILRSTMSYVSIAPCG